MSFIAMIFGVLVQTGIYFHPAPFKLKLLANGDCNGVGGVTKVAHGCVHQILHVFRGDALKLGINVV